MIFPMYFLLLSLNNDNYIKRIDCSLSVIYFDRLDSSIHILYTTKQPTPKKSWLFRFLFIIYQSSLPLRLC